LVALSLIEGTQRNGMLRMSPQSPIVTRNRPLLTADGKRANDIVRGWNMNGEER